MFRFATILLTLFVCPLVSLAQGTAPSANDPINASSRSHWLLSENFAPDSLADDLAVGAIDTLLQIPRDLNDHWGGFAKRTALVTGTYALKSAMEAGLGSLWAEDPRYVRTTNAKFADRIGHVIKFTFAATNGNGKTIPAYARFAAFGASNFIANTWETRSQSTSSQAGIRIGLSFLSRMSENAYREFIAKRK